ncbi:MAG: hypothetical protein K6G23_10840 [Lachnospiraceae bacterium]|nr:hypothetical protein [Lachnospiraceae bacterium]
MQVISKRPSIERCTESGWDAYDLITSLPIDDELIDSLRMFEGSFLYMKSLKRPFFKLEADLYVMKGVKGDPFFRVALHRDQEAYLDQMIDQINAANKR